MTRLYFHAGRLRLRMILIEAVVVVLFGAANLAGYSAFFEMPKEQLRAQALLFAVLIAVVFGTMAVYTWIYLRPVARLLRDLQEYGVSRPRNEEQARRAALRFPLSFAAVSLAVSTGALSLGLVGDVFLGGLELGFAVGLACATATELLVACTFIYLVARALMRPIVAHFRHEEVPGGIRIAIGGKVTFAIVSLCLAATVPTALICGVRVMTIQRQSHDRMRKHLADVLSHGHAALDPESRHRAIAAVRLVDGGRIRFRNTPAPTAAPAPRGGPGAYLEVVTAAPAAHPQIYLVVLVVLLLGLATFVGRALGRNLAHDVELVSGRIRQMAAGLPLSERKRLAPLVAEVPQFSDLRQLAEALNELLARLVAINVTHFLAIEKSLEAERVKTQFLANVSHDLRSPLNSVIGFSQLMLRDTEENLTAQQRREVEVIHRSGNDLLLLINEVLDSAKLGAGRITLHREDCLPAELLSQALKEIQRRGVPDGIQIETELQPGLQAVLVDPQRLIQATAHIIHHCMESIDRGRIVVQLGTESTTHEKTGEKQRLLRLMVSTSTGGSSDSALRGLFAGFRRRPGRRGLGLELPLAKAFIELHDGTLEATSAVGLGTTFTARIPVLQPKVLARLRSKNRPEG
jgi:signal transduction histidine kinase